MRSMAFFLGSHEFQFRCNLVLHRYMCCSEHTYLYIYWIELLHQPEKMNFILVMPSGFWFKMSWADSSGIEQSRAESNGVKLSQILSSWVELSQAVTIWSQLEPLKPNQVPKGITNLQFASSSHPTFVRLNDNSRCSNLNSWFLTYIHGMRWEYDDSRTNKRKLLLGGFISFYDLTSSSHFCRNQETRYKIYNIL